LGGITARCRKLYYLFLVMLDGYLVKIRTVVSDAPYGLIMDVP